MTYTGTEYTDTNLNTISAISGANWYDSSKMTLSLKEGTAKDAGTYNIDVSLIDDSDAWEFSNGTYSQDTQTIKLKINKAPSVANPQYTLPSPLYTSTGLPALSRSTGDTEGTFTWVTTTASSSNTKYTWLFTPVDIKNYETATGDITLNYIDAQITGIKVYLVEDKDIYDKYDTYTYTSLDSYLKSCLSVKLVYEDKTESSPIANSEYTVTTSDISVTSGDSEEKIISVRVTSTNAQINGLKGSVSATVNKAVIESMSVYDAATAKPLVYPLTLEEVKANYEVYLKWNFSARELKVDDSKVTVALKDSDELHAGTVDVTFTYTDGDLSEAEDKLNIAIAKGDYNIPDNLFADKTVTYTGTAYDPDGWIDTTKLPTGMTVTYSCETEMTEVKVHTVTATFSNPDPDNYNDPATKTAKLTITDKKIFNITAMFENDTVTYDGGNHKLEISGTLPEGVTVEYYIGEEKFTGAIKAGTYEVTAKFTHNNAEYADIDPITKTLKIEKATITLPEDIFKNKTELDDNNEHSIEVKGLPDNVTVTYEYDGKTQSEPFKFVKAGKYEVTAHFEPTDKDNYNEIADITATLTINDAVVTEIKAELAEKEYTTANALDDLKAKLKVTAVYNNGTTAEIEDYELDFTGLRDNDKFKYGNQSLTVKYGEFTTVVNNIIVSRQKVELPAFKGGLKYTGVEVKPKAADFNGYDEALMTFVADKTLSGLTVGSYKAVFALNDPENYVWATTTTVSKKVFAVALYDGEVTLLANEVAVDWNIARAVLTATKTDGGLPVFASESYIGAFSDVVALKYYKDEACTEEVAAEDLAYETTYYVKAELLDTENFELDASAEQYRMKSFSYTTPAKELTGFEKVLAVVKANWLWLVIAVVSVILLILIIALAVRASKKKREREEQRRLEEKAERERKEEREREERRLEREERMARMNQQQAMPQMMMPQMMPQMMGGQMPMQMPQSAPQSAQPAATGGGSTSDAQFAQIQSELAAMRAEQAAMRTEVAIRAEQAAMKAEQSVMHSEIYAMRGGEQTSGMPVDTLTEALTAALKNVLSSAAPQIIAAAPAQPAQITDGSATAPAATQVPPDAVMTTVTTTKIDTTKKPAQAAPQAQAAPSGRTIVRNYVAPMPVDDGRVFDVGGFYTPADPVTDLGFGDEENKD